MTVLMYDGINADAATIRAAWKPGDLVGWYAAGNSFIWTQAERALFPASALVSITLTASFLDADVLDVERGGATPAQVHAWIAAKKAAGYERPTIYCSLSTVPSVRAATGTYILGRDYDIWVADYNGTMTPPAVPGLPAASWAAWQREAGANYDVSMVFDGAWPHRTPPAPPVAPGIPAPAGLSVTPWTYLDMSWPAVTGATGYNVQARRDGVVVGTWPGHGTHAMSAAIEPGGVLEVRVQADGGEWTAWRQVS